MRIKLSLISAVFFLFSAGITAQTGNLKEYPDSLDHNLQLLKRYLSPAGKWHFTDNLTGKRLSGLIQFVENEPVDSLINHFKNLKADSGKVFLFRYPKDTPDTLSISGYISIRELTRQLKDIEEAVRQDYRQLQVIVPEELMKSIESQLPLVPSGQGMQLFKDGIYKLPDSLKVLEGVPEELVQRPEDLQRILRLDSIRSRFAEQKRLQYNDSLAEAARIKATEDYRKQLTDERITYLWNQKIESAKRNNLQVTKLHNDQVILAVNDSVLRSAEWLAGFADLIDNSTISLVNLTNASSSLVLSNAGNFFTRIWVKNQQNDSVSVLVRNLDKRSMQLVIEDQEIFSRFRQDAVKDFDFSSLNQSSSALYKLGKKYQAYTPWTIGGTGNTGFTQTYLSNWKKGGKSALSILVVMKGFAHYSADKYKWENNAEIRNGWIKPGDGDIQKNDDKLELTSRFGITAFQKWYYSAEADFETQFFNGYAYPNVTKPVSAWLSPGRFMFKIGLDYKPNKNFSLLLSPLTSKLVFVNDTLKIDKGNYKIGPGKSKYWEPGMNTDLYFKKSFSPDISFETKYKMFINYLAPFREIDLNWENLLNVRITDYITMQVMTHSIYDSKVLFDQLDKEGNPVLDSAGKKIRKPKLQFREFFTIGFVYRINHRVIRAREVI